jgi:glycosyltransferase involved in cell wall biosynthesis
MRILIANEARRGSGGVESYLSSLMPALGARGHAVALLHANRRSEGGATDLGASADLTASVADDGIDRAIEAVRGWRPDVCFSHNMRPLDVEERLLAEWPVVKMMHGYFGTCIGGQKAHAFPEIVACSRRFGAACLMLYLPRHCGQYRPLQMIEEYRWASRQRSLLPRYAGVVAASGHMAQEYAREGVDASRLIVAPLFPTIGAAGAPRTPPATPTVLFAGRMTSIKGGDAVVRAVADAAARSKQRIKLIMAGDGPERARLEALATALGVEARFTGWVTGDARVELIRSATVVAVPSLWPEPFGLSGLEAGIHGVPAIAFDVGGIREWLRDGVNGTLVPSGDVTAMGEAIAAVVADAAALARLGEGAVRVARELSLDAHIQKIEAALSRAARTPAAA